jgi:hypothetical protein
MGAIVRVLDAGSPGKPPRLELSRMNLADVFRERSVNHRVKNRSQSDHPRVTSRRRSHDALGTIEVLGEHVKPHRLRPSIHVFDDLLDAAYFQHRQDRTEYLQRSAGNPRLFRNASDTDGQIQARLVT